MIIEQIIAKEKKQKGRKESRKEKRLIV